MTTTQDVWNLARPLMDEHGLAGWKLEFDNRRTRFGYCDYTRQIISISRPVLLVNTLETVRLTVVHEIAHALCGPEHGHDRVWRRQCLALGGNGQRVSSAAVVAIPTGRYIGACPTCAAEYQRYKMTPSITERSLFCTKCLIHGDFERGRLNWRKRA
jgi:predicted SprT family Zn-dependent metalloprotease